MRDDLALIQGCKGNDRIAQQRLYMKYAPKMRGVCLRYAKDEEEAKDFLQEGFIKVFSKISQYSGQGSFEGWIRKIIVNTTITQLKKDKKLKTDRIEDFSDYEHLGLEGEEADGLPLVRSLDLSEKELLEALYSLPEVFKVVFNLFYIEEYSHKEISDMLGIDEKTSRTRLFRARKMLREMLEDKSVKKIKAS